MSSFKKSIIDELSETLSDKEKLSNFLTHVGNIDISILEKYINTSALTPHEGIFMYYDVDPRESSINELFYEPGLTPSMGHKNVMIRHHYTLPSRRSGTIYEKQTYVENVQHHLGTDTCNNPIPSPPELWFRSLGGSVDYVNGTLHFPMRMPSIGEDFRSYTIRRYKVSAEYLLFIAAQLEFDRKHNNAPVFCDSSISYVADILSGKKSLDSKQYTPRKISVTQTKELLHAWVLVYVYQKKEYLPVLEYYLYAGYVVNITKKCGGNHEK